MLSVKDVLVKRLSKSANESIKLMLFQRLLTAIVLLPMVLWLVLFSSADVFSILLAFVIAIAAYEWAMLSGLTGFQQILFALVSLGSNLGIWYFHYQDILLMTLIPTAMVWLSLTLLLIFRRREIIHQSVVSVASLLMGFYLLMMAWVSMTKIYSLSDEGPHLLLSLLLLIWIADTFAYFVGRALGKTKLSPFVSPGKTWEGVIGGMLGAVIYAYFLASRSFFLDHAIEPLELMFVCSIVVFISVGGDLFESKIKRQRGVKDSGKILPGHGGVYDRIDSLIAAAPVFLLSLLWMMGEVNL